jgi:hypothetical protein
MEGWGVLDIDTVEVVEGVLERLTVDEALVRGAGRREGDAPGAPEKYEYKDTEQGFTRLLHRRTVQQVAALQGAGLLGVPT